MPTGKTIRLSFLAATRLIRAGQPSLLHRRSRRSSAGRDRENNTLIDPTGKSTVTKTFAIHYFDASLRSGQPLVEFHGGFSLARRSLIDVGCAGRNQDTS